MARDITKIGPDDERQLRRWLMSHDPTFALHRQLKDYFLADTMSFGALCAWEGAAMHSVCFFSKDTDKSFIHQYFGDLGDLNDFRLFLGVPCQAFFRAGSHPGGDWEKVLDVTPGFVVDHSAYSGVFSRVSPRFAGSVYEHK